MTLANVPGRGGRMVGRVGAPVAAAALLSLGLPGVALAQQEQAPQPPQPPAPSQTPVQPPAPELPKTTALPAVPGAPATPASQTPQPSAKTPPTPLPKKAPSVTSIGIPDKNVPATNVFNEKNVPGQPVEGDPAVIRTLEDALTVAYRRAPGILLARERAVSTQEQIKQILALRNPQVSATGTYARLANLNSQGAGGGGVTPSQIQNPFGSTLQITPPGAAPITLSTTGISGGGTTTSAGTSTTANTVATGSSASGVNAGASTVTRAQETPGTRQNTGGNGGNGGTGNGGTGNGGTGNGGTGNGNGTTTTPNFARALGAPLDQVNARVSITQLVDITGVVRAALQVGDLQKALSRLEIERTRQQATLDVKNSYYQVLRAQAFVGVNEAAVAQSEELLRVTQAQLRAGVASQFDVLRSQTQLDNNRQALINSRNQVAIAKNALANQLGIDPSTPIEPVAQDVPPTPALDEEALVTAALTKRPEALQADINLLSASKNIRLARRNLEPFLNLGLSGAYNATPGPATLFKDTGAFTATLTVPLYDGGATRAAVGVARSDERGAFIQRDQFIRGIKSEVQQAIIAVRDASERASVAGGTVTQAQEALRLANVRFRAGVGTQLDVNDAQTSLIQAQTNQVNATFDYLGALARLSRATGSPD